MFGSMQTDEGPRKFYSQLSFVNVEERRGQRSDQQNTDFVRETGPGRGRFADLADKALRGQSSVKSIGCGQINGIALIGGNQ